MGRLCVMRSCEHSFAVKSKPEGLVVHRFPEGADLKQAWENFVNLCNRTSHFKANSTHRLCSLHFEESCYSYSGLSNKWNGGLRGNAVPTLATKFTAERAFKFGLIPSLESNFLDKVNDFSMTPDDLKQLSPQVNVSVIENPTSKLIITRIEDSDKDDPHIAALDSSESITDCNSLLHGKDIQKEVIVFDSLLENSFTVDPLAICSEEDFAKNNSLRQRSTGHVKKLTCSANSINSANNSKDNPIFSADPDSEIKSDNSQLTADQERSVQRTRLPRKTYIGDLKKEDFATPQGLNLSVDLIHKSVDIMRQRHKTTQQRLRRSLKTIHNLKLFLHDLVDNNLVSDEVNKMIRTRLKCFGE